MPKRYKFLTSCVDARGSDIQEMVDRAREITYKTLLSHVGAETLRKQFPDYEWNRRGGLKLSSDYAVSFHASRYRGRKCYYVRHSCIEYVFV